MRSVEFSEILPLLVSSYQRGRLVPFLGAGMSTPRLALWDEFVENLEKNFEQHQDHRAISPDVRAQRDCTRIRNTQGPEKFIAAVRGALEKNSDASQANLLSLAKIRWPLVVSTNYDDLFFQACRCRREQGTAPEEMRVEIL